MNNSLVSDLRELLKLEERRGSLADELDQLQAKIQQLRSRVASGDTRGAQASSGVTRAPRAAKSTGATAPASRRRGRAQRGALKEQILRELEGAGPNGIAVKDLSDRIGAKSANVHAWFHTTGRKVPGLKRVGPGRYALSSSKGSAAKTEAASAAPKPGRRGRKPAAAPAKAAKPTAKARGGRSKRGGKRGELMEGILSQLKSAGSKGITVKALSEKLGVPYKNVYIWFVTTGKKNPGIKRIAPATYRLES